MTIIKSLTPQQFMESYRLLIADADGTIRLSIVPGQPCPNKPGDWELIPAAQRWLLQVDWDRYYLGIASNQAGIAYGFLTEEVAYQMLKDTVVAAINRFPPTDTIQLCASKDKQHPDRKPQPGMLLKLMQRWQVASWQTLMVGDMESDMQAAEAAGCDFIWAWDLFGFEEGKNNANS